METIANDAQRVSLLFEFGLMTSNDVIAWADSVIIKMDSLPDSLVDLSLTAPDKTADLISHLHRVASRADFWTAVRSAIPQIRDFIVAHPDQAESMAYRLYLTASRALHKVPKDLMFMLRFEDRFSLANDGIIGERPAVYRDFADELNKFT